MPASLTYPPGRPEAGGRRGRAHRREKKFRQIGRGARRAQACSRAPGRARGGQGFDRAAPPDPSRKLAPTGSCCGGLRAAGLRCAAADGRAGGPGGARAQGCGNGPGRRGDGGGTEVPRNSPRRARPRGAYPARVRRRRPRPLVNLPRRTGPRVTHPARARPSRVGGPCHGGTGAALSRRGQTYPVGRGRG